MELNLKMKNKFKVPIYVFIYEFRINISKVVIESQEALGTIISAFPVQICFTGRSWLLSLVDVFENSICFAMMASAWCLWVVVALSLMGQSSGCCLCRLMGHSNGAKHSPLFLRVMVALRAQWTTFLQISILVNVFVNSMTHQIKYFKKGGHYFKLIIKVIKNTCKESLMQVKYFFPIYVFICEFGITISKVANES